MNSTVAPRASPMAKPRKAASARSCRLKAVIPGESLSKVAGGHPLFSADDEILPFSFERMRSQQRIKKRHLGDRHLNGEDRVSETVRDAAIGRERSEIVEPHQHGVLVDAIHDLVFVEGIDSAVEGDVGLAGDHEAFQRPLAELEQQVELNIDGVVVKAAR